MTAVSEVCSILERGSVLESGRFLIGYRGLSWSRQQCIEKYGDLYDACFWPRVFLSFPSVRLKAVSDTHEAAVYVETRCVQKYVQHYARVLRAKKELEVFGSNGRLTRDDIATYVSRRLRSLYALEAKNNSHLSAACQLATNKFRFYHERRRELKVAEVSTGVTLWEMEQALNSAQSVEMKEQEGLSNWFTAKVLFGIVDTFATVAGGFDGELSLSQFMSIRAFSTLSPSFTASLFRRLKSQTDPSMKAGCNADEGVMDLEQYGNLVIAWNDRSSEPAVRYLFKILDTHDKGCLTSEDIFIFVNETVELFRMVDSNEVYDAMARDIVTEILDIVGPKVPGRVTTQDIIACKNGFEVFGMMADASELFRHEHKDDQ